MKTGSFMLKIFLVAAILLAFVPKGFTLEKPRMAEPVKKKTQVIEKEAWKAEWDKTLEAAKKEGKVMIYSTPSTDVIRTVAKAFEEKYGIIV